MSEDWSNALEGSKNVDIVYVDFKAFYTVPHARLINKLHAYGIRGQLFMGIKNFLTNSKHKVVIQ